MTDHPLLVFDLDGTLFKTESVTIPAVTATFQRHGLTPPEDRAIMAFFGRPWADFHEWLRGRGGDDVAATMGREIDRLEMALISEVGEWYPGAREAIRELRGWAEHMVICSNGTPEYVRCVLEVHAVGRLFDAVRWRLSQADTKSLMVGEILKRWDGRPAVVIGDREDDIRAAHDNGLMGVGASYGYGVAGELAEADALASSASELPSVLARLLSADLVEPHSE